MDNDTLVLSGLAGIGAGVLLLGAVPHIAATLAATFIIGFAFAAIMVPAQTLMQRETPPEMIARRVEHQHVGAFLAQILGLPLSGILAESCRRARGVLSLRGLSVALAAAGRMFLQTSRQN